jgi:hypothetical protein
VQSAFNAVYLNPPTEACTEGSQCTVSGRCRTGLTFL